MATVGSFVSRFHGQHALKGDILSQWFHHM